MFINSRFKTNPSFQFRCFAPMPSLSQGERFPKPMESSMFSSSANLYMMMNMFNTMMEGFQSGTILPNRANFGPRTPVSCFLGPQPAGASVKPMAQSNSVSCGQTSVAMAVNSLTGKQLTDRDINRRHGFGLLTALNSESRGSGYKWKDAGNFQAKNWPTLERKLNQEKTPVIIGLNGPNFSRSGRGHIITLLSVEGNKVKYADPADGKIKYTTKQAIQSAPPHPNGKFFMIASRA